MPKPKSNPSYVFLPYQQAWVADKSQVKIFVKSRRIGISWAEAGDDALYAARANGGNVFYIAHKKDVARQFVEDAGWWAKQYQEIVSEVYEDEYEDVLRDGNTRYIQAFVVKFASGHTITALSSRPDNFRSKQGRVVIDEAAFHYALDELIGAAMALTMWEDEIRIISTYNSVDNYFYELIQSIRAQKLTYSLHETTLRQAVDQGLYKRICLMKGRVYSKEAEAAWMQQLYDNYPDKAIAAEELDCIPRSGSDVYLSRALIEAVMQPNIPVVRLALESEFLERDKFYREAWMNDWCVAHLKPVLTSFNPNLNHFLGADFARSGDLTVIWILEEQKDLHLSTPLVVELRNIPFDQQKQIMLYLCKRIPKFMSGAVDGRNNGEYIAEVMDVEFGGIFYRTNDKPGVRATVEFYRQAMPRMKARFEDKSLTIPRDSDILADLRSIVLDKGVAKVPEGLRLKGTSGSFRHGDAGVALSLVIWASIQEISIYAYHSAIYPTDSTQDNYANFLRPPDDDEPQHTSHFKSRVDRWKN